MTIKMDEENKEKPEEEEISEEEVTEKALEDVADEEEVPAEEETSVEETETEEESHVEEEVSEKVFEEEADEEGVGKSSEEEPIVEEKEEERVITREIEKEMKSSYMDYSMSVIVGRALPDIRDGLKPVHRRILYAMNQMGMNFNKPYKKSARIVGEVLGKYHPHGDSAVYDAMVRMVQTFSLRYPLVNGQGNFGSIDGDSAAAMRYTEARMQKITDEILQDIDKETVKFVDNFDGSLKEPDVLPAKLPNLLINGSSGIAVGMATNIPPHNLVEVGNAIIATIDNPDISIETLRQHVKGPDFPTGGIICGINGINLAYQHGRGKVIVRAKADVEQMKKRERIIITEIPYMVNKAMLVEEIAHLVRDKKVEGISDLRDESDREGMRVVIELKIGANPEIVLNQLYKHSRMQTTFGIIMLSLVDKKPVVLNLKSIIQEYIHHRQIVVRKRTEFDMKKAQARAHILEGLIIALDHIDEVIAKIKASKAVEDAKAMLMKDYELSEDQSKAILEMRLQKLSSLERQKIKDEHKVLLELINKLNAILASEQEILNIIKKEVSELVDKYGDERRTEINVEFEEEGMEFDIEDLIKPEDMVVTITHAGYVKRLPIDTYHEQKRGGKGVIGTGTKEEDFVEDLFVANTHDYILFFTNYGKVKWLKVFRMPEAGRLAKGTPLVNLIQFDKGERVESYVKVKDFKEGYVMMCTKNGKVKKTMLEEFSRPRRGGIQAIDLREGDELINSILTDGNEQVMIMTKSGNAVKFKETDVRPMGRTAAGVRGISLREGDEVVDMVRADDGMTILTITENGYGKRTKVSEYRLTKRGSMGVRNIITNERNGNVVAVKAVTGETGLLFMSKEGIAIRTSADGISVMGRNTQGVRLMKLAQGDKVVAAAKIVSEDINEQDSEQKEADVKVSEEGSPVEEEEPIEQPEDKESEDKNPEKVESEEDISKEENDISDDAIASEVEESEHDISENADKEDANDDFINSER